MPILEVTLAVQTLIHGFRDDLPETEEALAAFLATEGRWEDWAEQVPEEYVQRGRSLGSSGSSVREIDLDANRCVLTRRRFHPTRAYFVSWIARIFSLKNSRSRNPYACRFIVLILLFVPSSGPLLIITS
jgi:hypothetical protein